MREENGSGEEGSAKAPGIPRIIIAYHADAEGHWVAELDCGHAQHVRHDPPWQNRPWVITEEGRRRFLGTELRCVLCVRDDD